MKKAKGNWGLLNKKRFEKWEQERKQSLRKLSWKKAIRLEEKMLSSKLIWEWRKNFSKDKPVCLKISLHNRRPKR
jgi:hypothetical protein